MEPSAGEEPSDYDAFLQAFSSKLVSTPYVGLLDPYSDVYTSYLCVIGQLIQLCRSSTESISLNLRITLMEGTNLILCY